MCALCVSMHEYGILYVHNQVHLQCFWWIVANSIKYIAMHLQIYWRLHNYPANLCWRMSRAGDIWKHLRLLKFGTHVTLRV